MDRKLKTASGSSHSSRSSRSSRSSLRLAKAIAKQEVARCAVLRQLQEKRILEEKEFELKHQREVLKPSHQLQKAAIERQVFEEELERGGYIPPNDQKPTTSADFTVVISQTEQVRLPFTGVDSAAQTVTLPVHSLPLETKPKVTLQGSTQLDSSRRKEMKPRSSRVYENQPWSCSSLMETLIRI